jgi:hypothetical protein
MTKGGVPFMEGMSLPKAWRKAALLVMTRIKKEEVKAGKKK